MEVNHELKAKTLAKSDFFPGLKIQTVFKWELTFSGDAFKSYFVSPKSSFC